MARRLFVCILGFLLIGLHSAPAQELRSRAFSFENGEPGTALELRSADGARSTRFVLDGRGAAEILHPAADGERLRLVSRTADFEFEMVIEIRPAPPGTIETLDLAGRGRRLAAPVLAAPSFPEPRSREIDPCEDPSSPSCLRRWTELVEARSCAAVIELDEHVRSVQPGFAAPAMRYALAEAFLDCAARAEDSGGLRAWAGRALHEVEMASKGRGWCEERPSSLLAEAHDLLGDSLSAALSVASSAGRCMEAERARIIEWEVFFLLRAGRESQAAARVRDAEGLHRLFLSLWTARSARDCSDDWRLLLGLEAPPCASLPPRLCAERGAEVIFACGTSGADFDVAARWLGGSGGSLWAGALLLSASASDAERLAAYQAVADDPASGDAARLAARNNLAVLRARELPRGVDALRRDLDALAASVADDPAAHPRIERNLLVLRWRLLGALDADILDGDAEERLTIARRLSELVEQSPELTASTAVRLHGPAGWLVFAAAGMDEDATPKDVEPDPGDSP